MNALNVCARARACAPPDRHSAAPQSYPRQCLRRLCQDGKKQRAKEQAEGGGRTPRRAEHRRRGCAVWLARGLRGWAGTAMQVGLQS
eukprot:12828260-Alexandrium_andersonii.AAC.1